MSVVFSYNRLLNSFMIVLSYKRNGFPTSNMVDYRVLLGLKEYITVNLVINTLG